MGDTSDPAHQMSLRTALLESVLDSMSEGLVVPLVRAARGEETSEVEQFLRNPAVLDLTGRLEQLGKAGDFSPLTDRLSQDLAEELARVEQALSADPKRSA